MMKRTLRNVWSPERRNRRHVDVYLPVGTSSQVLLGQRTVAGETIVARAGVSELIEGVAQ